MKKKTRKPALMLPMGKRDWGKGARWAFLQSMLPILEALGWTIGVELKLTRDPESNTECVEDWVIECCEAVKAVGGTVTWHPAWQLTENMGREGFAVQAENIAAIARKLSEYLSLVTIHGGMYTSSKDEPKTGERNARYASPIGPVEMLDWLDLQLDWLTSLQAMLGDVPLSLENVDIALFSPAANYGGDGRKYLAMQTGCWGDLAWLTSRAGIAATVDSEHFFEARSTLMRLGDLEDLPQPTMFRDERAVARLVKMTGYTLEEGYAPVAEVCFNYGDYLGFVRPAYLHIGGATSSFDAEGRVNTHLPITNLDDFRDEAVITLYETLSYMLNAGEYCLGACVEVGGSGTPGPGNYTWSPRPADDDEAKMATYKIVVEAIKRLGTTTVF